jgi:hypothetical protein
MATGGGAAAARPTATIIKKGFMNASKREVRRL